MRPGGRFARHGLTFLETVCAAALLALVAATILGAFNTMMADQERQRHRLGAAEVANRLILQYLDDKTALPSQALPVAYAGERYRWSLTETPARIIPARPEVAAERAGRTTLSLDRISAVAVTVWLGEESGGSSTIEPGTPSARLSRLVDPLAAARNPDSMDNMFKDPAAREEFLRRFRQIGNNAVQTPAPAREAPAAAPAQPRRRPAATPVSPNGDPVRPRRGDR